MNLETLLEQEDRLQFTHFDANTAWALGEHLRTRAVTENKALVVEVYAFQQILYRTATPGTHPEQHFLVERKRASVLRFGNSSFYLGQAAQAKGTTFEAKEYIDVQQYAGHGGGFPLRLKGMGIIGVVTVSGLPQAEDHQWVVDALVTFI